MTLMDRIAALLPRSNRAAEAEVLAALAAASADELDTVLTGLDAAGLFASLDDRLVGPDHHTALRTLMTERAAELSIDAQAALIHALQAGHTDAADEQAIARVFETRHGAELTRLKNQLNTRKDDHDLEGLVYGDVDDPAIRQRILDHIEAEARGVHPGEAKVLCDSDDTVVCALHDRRYPRGTVYPGILALLDALDRGPHEEPYSLGDLTFVTARPADVFGLIENHTRRTLRAAGIATHTMLSGTFLAMTSLDRMAGRKVANIEHYHALFPEYRLVFIGDSGQGDIAVARSMWERFDDVLDLTVIHDVVGTPDAERARLRTERILLVDTYAEAARLFRERGLIGDAGLQRVIDESATGLDAVRWASVEQERTTRALFERDTSS